MGTPTDPTMLSLAQLNDPAVYTRYDNVPVFKSHTRKAKKADGTEFTITVNDADLETIADDALKVIAYEGVPLKITDGHCKPDPKVPESEQPAVIGWATNPHVGTFGPSKEKAVLVTQYIRNDKLELLKKNGRPFRSAEYYPPTKQITGVAMLTRDPYLNMGFISYHRSGGRNCVFYSMENDMPDPAAPAPSASEEFTPEEVQHFEKLCRYMQMKGYMAPPAAAAAAPMTDPAAGPASPGGDNTSLPTDKDKGDPAMMSKNADPVLYARMEKLEKENAVLKLTTQREACTKILEALAPLRVFNHDREMRTLLGMTDAERAEQAQYIRDCYEHKTGSDEIVVYEGHAEGGIRQTPLDEDQRKKRMSEATRIMQREPGIDPAVAYERATEVVTKKAK